MTAKFYAKNFPFLTDPADGTYAWNFTINKELDKAIDHLSGPIYQDPRVADRLAGDPQCIQQIRTVGRTMPEQPEWI